MKILVVTIIVLGAASALFHSWVLIYSLQHHEVPFPLPDLALLAGSVAIVVAASITLKKMP